MRTFVELLQVLDEAEDPGHSISALRQYFENSPDEERKWALYLLSGRKLRKCATAAQLKSWAADMSRLPLWLLDESYHAVGDLAETLALVLPPPAIQSTKTIAEWMQTIGELPGLSDTEKQRKISEAWAELSIAERILFNRFVLGTSRSPVPESLLFRAVATSFSTDPTAIAHSMTSNRDFEKVTLNHIIGRAKQTEKIVRPYPFLQARPLTDPVQTLGNHTEWQAEWIPDGLRAQLIKRGGEMLVWSIDEALLTEKLPEILNHNDRFPDGTVLDGHLLALKNETPQPSSVLGNRLSKTSVSAKVIREVPVRFVACDIMERSGEDLRNQPLSVRRRTLEQMLKSIDIDAVRLSLPVEFSSWEDLMRKKERAREYRAWGVILKRLASGYHNDTELGNWWECKAEPLSVNAVLLYAERGSGERPDLYSRYTFAVWHNETLVPCAKTWSGLSEEDVAEIDAFVRTHTRETFGPVRTVSPELVFEIVFDDVEFSRRRKSGVVLTLPRVLRWLREAKIEEADALGRLHAMAGKKSKIED